MTCHENEVEEITRLAAWNSADIPEDSRFLLEIDPLRLDTSLLEQKEYWIVAMNASKIAGRQVALGELLHAAPSLVALPIEPFG